jgi:hypothetical protein
MEDGQSGVAMYVLRRSGQKCETARVRASILEPLEREDITLRAPQYLVVKECVYYNSLWQGRRLSERYQSP